MGFKCMGCGQELESPATKHTWDDCDEYKDKCSPSNLERRITGIEETLTTINEALEGVYFRK